MRIHDSGLQLCYSLNVYQGTSLEAKIEIIRKRIPIIRELIPGASDAPFALGLWLNCECVSKLGNKKELHEFKKILDKNNCYIFTVNAFPYGNFHDRAVKEKVYLPDWSDTARVDYTRKVADILAELLPADITGSISTVPGAYALSPLDDRKLAKIKHNLLATACYLKQIDQTSGKKITLAIEMEPDCLWESADDFITFYREHFANSDASKYIGVCYDTCHQELLATSPGEGLLSLAAAGIKIAKIQLSSAISVCTSNAESFCKEFADTVYLHQTRGFDTAGKRLFSYPDIPASPSNADISELWVSHFHIPVYCKGSLQSEYAAQKNELEKVLDIVAREPEICRALEIETYTYSVLPASFGDLNMEQSIATEYNWVIDKVNTKIKGSK